MSERKMVVKITSKEVRIGIKKIKNQARQKGIYRTHENIVDEGMKFFLKNMEK